MTGDEFREQIARAVRATLTEMGREIVADIRESISVPVQHVKGFGTIRSEPGEPPRREHGNLWRSIKRRIEPRSKTIEDLVVYCDSVIGLWLEYGTANIEPRPFMEPARQRFSNLQEEFQRRLSINIGMLGTIADVPIVDSAYQGD